MWWSLQYLFSRSSLYANYIKFKPQIFRDLLWGKICFKFLLCVKIWYFATLVGSSTFAQNLPTAPCQVAATLNFMQIPNLLILSSSHTPDKVRSPIVTFVSCLHVYFNKYIGIYVMHVSIHSDVFWTWKRNLIEKYVFKEDKCVTIKFWLVGLVCLWWWRRGYMRSSRAVLGVAEASSPWDLLLLVSCA